MKLKEKIEKSLLDYFFDFLNFDLDKLNYDNLIRVSLAYVRFAFHDDADTLKKKHELLSRPTYNQDDDELNEVKIFLSELQDHFKGTLDKICNPSASTLRLKQRGERTISLEGDRFVQNFSIDDRPPEGLDLEQEIPYAESIFADILINEELLPKRFKKCRQCQNFFYQNTNRRMIYCSTKCSNLYRQKKSSISTTQLFSSERTFSKNEFANLDKKRKELFKKDKDKEIEKLKKKLPLWAVRQNQINAKILTLFLRLENQGLSEITEEILANEYGNPSEFNRNFTQMKIIADKNHGKVFHVKDGVVKIWEPARELVEKYKKDVFG